MESKLSNAIDIPVASSHEMIDSRYAWYVTTLLMVGYTFSFLDREILFLLIDPIRSAFDLTDFQMGLLLGPAFGVFYTIMGVPLGWAADKYNRKWLITIGVSLWSIMTASCGLAKSFTLLFMARIGVGIGEATLSPSAVSLLSDYFSKDKLPRAMSIYSTGVFLGSGLAMILGGELIARIEGISVTLPWLGTLEYWQLTFIMAGLPGLVLMLFIMSVREPKRKGLARSADGVDEKVDFRRVLVFLFKEKKLFFSLFIGGSVIAAIAYLSAWYPELFIRTWGWPRLWAARASGWPAIIGGTAGLFFCGWYIQYLTRKGYKDAALRVALIGGVLIAIPACLMPLMPNPWAATFLLIVIKFFIGFPLVTGTTAIRMIAPNQMRGQLTAIYFIFIGIISNSGGPLIPGFITTYIFNGQDDMLRYSLSISAALLVPIGSWLLWSGRHSYGEAVERIETLEKES